MFVSHVKHWLNSGPVHVKQLKWHFKQDFVGEFDGKYLLFGQFDRQE
jgi:hypothetical protein